MTTMNIQVTDHTYDLHLRFIVFHSSDLVVRSIMLRRARADACEQPEVPQPAAGDGTPVEAGAQELPRSVVREDHGLDKAAWLVHPSRRCGRVGLCQAVVDMDSIAYCTEG